MASLFMTWVSLLSVYMSIATEDDDDSGITIFGEEETKEEEKVNIEEGEILESSSLQEPKRKMTVGFPGINAPIPENADLRLWQQRGNTEHTYYRDHIRNRDYRGELGPPVVEPSSSYPPRYYGFRYDQGSALRPRSPGSDNSEAERVRRYYHSFL